MQPRHYFWLSTVAALATIALKTLAWSMTGSIGLLSDAMESFVNLAGAVFALWMIIIAKSAPDKDHPLGYSKAEYFSSGFEGILIFGAAGAIIWSAAGRLFSPAPLEQVGFGLALSLGASLINLFVALSMRRAAVRFRSMALEGGARHLMTDVWTSAGVSIGVALVGFTGWLWLDAAVAILVGLHILSEGWGLIRTSAHGLMDASIEDASIQDVEGALAAFATRGVDYANLSTRRAGSQNFVYVDILVPPDWTILRTHDVCWMKLNRPSGDLLMTERLGIEIDYCPQCRGVWLDRAELDKIIERSVREPVQVVTAPAPQVHRPAQQHYKDRHDYHEKQHDEHSGYRRKKSIWQELFD